MASLSSQSTQHRHQVTGHVLPPSSFFRKSRRARECRTCTCGKYEFKACRFSFLPLLFCSLLLLQLSFLSLPFHHPFSFSSVLIFFLLCSSLLVFSPFYLPVFIFPVSLFLFQSFALLPFFPLGSCLSLFLSPFSFLFAPVLFITFLRSFFTLCRFS